MKLTRRQFSAALAASVAMPGVLRTAHAQGATIKIGMVIPVTGPAAESGKYALTGAKIALERVNKAGGVLAKQAEIITEDDQTTNPGAVLAFSKLAAQPDIVAFLGSIRSTQVHAMTPDLIKVGKPMMFGGTDPALTKLGNRWLFRFRPNDSYSGRVIASFGTETLGKKNWAVVHSTDAFGTNGSKALTEALGKIGAKVAIDQGYPNQSQDFTPVVLAIKQSGADIIGSYFTFENDLAIFARQLRQLGVTIPWVGSPSITVATAVKLAGPALYGTYGVADYAEESSDAAREFGKLYRAASGGVSPDNFGSWTYDAIGVLCAAINKAGSTDPEKIREAIIATKGYKGAEGEYNFDEFGDGLHGYNIVRNEKGTIIFDKHIEFEN
ncbi:MULTISPECIES: ABC transporter substrate-binding protein [Rhodomicrobium]|uniref:ABC transporter substrate-binding protein n=1 Tax=Rhodomicrobium TaxID=1068 RepID=UPI000B4AAD89|nr:MULTISPECIES: ABC transporter substrate-binding protein [Rhodomicrobium]